MSEKQTISALHNSTLEDRQYSNPPLISTQLYTVPCTHGLNTWPPFNVRVLITIFQRVLITVTILLHVPTFVGIEYVHVVALGRLGGQDHINLQSVEETTLTRSVQTQEDHIGQVRGQVPYHEGLSYRAARSHVKTRAVETYNLDGLP